MAADTLSLSSLSSIPVSFASCSLSSHPSHTLPAKLRALSSAGFTGIELSMPDLLSHASSLNSNREIPPDDYPTLCSAAKDVAALCAELGLEIMLLQPFANFEAWPPQSKERKEAFERAEGWISILQASGCKTLQVGSTDTPAEKLVRGKDGSVDRDVVVKDLQELAGMLEEKGCRLAYENWCWSSHAPDWRDVWDIVRKVDRGNVGLCLDTFQTAGGEWADPRTESGRVEGEGVEGRWKESLEALGKEIPADKIYLLQISDAYKLEEPITKEDEDGLRPRGRWSHDYRPLPGKGYLPVAEVAKAVLKTGFRGWFSYEVFDFPPWKKGKVDLDGYAQEAFACQKTLVEECADKGVGGAEDTL
ncbi:putative 4-hydroxyphenylpyruvate dioxygenase [Myriangium duriaei CBS 260.36]|uniref:4-hydroxyphenylpyruvate dioxygenase n=1 Tax=Myriangium duriaei CBS 260.36 TaxID=1168546 RepID=A0A9P4IWJ7_9PEZI|nr:putative 4-hydroxyphenylpyruvate dioxygenase [Myriangium duriaei CBS 260.36]